ncbi:hypothetical protein AB0M72_03490 [Nocardiopsis dassonvillei]
METSTDTVPRIGRCTGCRHLVLSAWSGLSSITLALTAYSAEAAALAFVSGHEVYRVRTTRRPTLIRVTEDDGLMQGGDYLLAHTCQDAPMPVPVPLVVG